MPAVQLQVNAQALVHNLRLAFTSKTTFLAELMQNARRAKATRIVIDYDEETKVLVVADDGIGIDDMQHLLTVAESGWDEQTKMDETPYGLGFLSALFQAEHVIVHSGHQLVSFDTCKVLDFEQIQSRTISDYQKGTRVELTGIDNPNIAPLVKGFPVPVIYNGNEIERPHAVDVLAKTGQLHEAEGIGHYLVPDLDKPFDGTTLGEHDYVLYLQGFVVFVPRIRRRKETIVHLDPRRFKGRLPDRDSLVDPEQACRAINGFLRNLWHRRIDWLCENTTAYEVAAKGVKTLLHWNKIDKLNEIDYLPPGVVRKPDGYPIQYQDWEVDYQYQSVSDPIHKADIESGKIKVFILDGEYVDDEGFQTRMYARAAGGLVYHRPRLDPQHWLYQYLVRLHGQNTRVVPHGQTDQSHVVCNWFDTTLMLCNEVSIDGPVGRANIRETFYGHVWDAEGDCLGDPMIFSPKSDTGNNGRVARQICSYVDEAEQFDEDSAERGETEIHRIIASKRNEDPAKLFTAVLFDTSVREYSNFRDRTFQVTFDDAGSPQVSIVK